MRFVKCEIIHITHQQYKTIPTVFHVRKAVGIMIMFEL